MPVSLREQAEQDAHQKSFQVVAGVTAVFQGIVKLAHDLDGFDVDGVLLLEGVLLVAGNEGELVDVAVEIGEGKLVRDAAPVVKQRQVVLFFRLKIVQGDPGKIRNDDVAWNFVESIFIGKLARIVERLRFRLAEILPERFMLDQQLARPEEVNITVLPRDFLDRLFKRRHQRGA